VSTTIWVIVALAIGTYVIRASGVVLPGKVKIPAQVQRYLPIAATTMLLALTLTSVLIEGGEWSFGIARPAGVLAGGLLAWRKAPFILIVLAAAVVAAGLRALGVP
jgi:branched-subunit amino acid transport protein